jgi:hypothetical protein
MGPIAYARIRSNLLRSSDAAFFCSAVINTEMNADLIIEYDDTLSLINHTISQHPGILRQVSRQWLENNGLHADLEDHFLALDALQCRQPVGLYGGVLFHNPDPVEFRFPAKSIMLKLMHLESALYICPWNEFYWLPLDENEESGFQWVTRLHNFDITAVPPTGVFLACSPQDTITIKAFVKLGGIGVRGRAFRFTGALTFGAFHSFCDGFLRSVADHLRERLSDRNRDTDRHLEIEIFFNEDDRPLRLRDVTCFGTSIATV